MVRKLHTMRIEHVGTFMVFFLLFSSLFGSALEDYSTPSKESDANWVEVLAINCRLELMYLTRIYEGLSIPDPQTTSTENVPNDELLALENMKRTFRAQQPQIREELFKCLRENYLLSQVFSKDVRTDNGYQNYGMSSFPKANIAAADSRRQLGEAAAGGHMAVIIVTVAVTAIVTSVLAVVVIFCCFGQYVAPGPGYDCKDDPPLLSVSRNDSSTGGSTPITRTTSESSVHNENIMDQSLDRILSSKIENIFLDLSKESDGSVALNLASPEPSRDSSVGRLSASPETSSNFRVGRLSMSPSAGLPPLKPPLGRLSVSPSSAGLPPLKPPPGRLSVSSSSAALPSSKPPTGRLSVSSSSAALPPSKPPTGRLSMSSSSADLAPSKPPTGRLSVSSSSADLAPSKPPTGRLSVSSSSADLAPSKPPTGRLSVSSSSADLAPSKPPTGRLSVSSSSAALAPSKPPTGRLSMSSSSAGLLKPLFGKLTGSSSSSGLKHAPAPPVPAPAPTPAAPAPTPTPTPTPAAPAASSPPPPPTTSAPAPPPPPRSAGPPPPPPPNAPGPPPPPLKRSGPGPPGPPLPPGGKGPPGPPPPRGGGPPRPASNRAAPDPNKAKLKPFFWDKVLAGPEQQMVWNEIKAGSFQFNEEMIESLFGYNASAAQTEKKKETKGAPPPQFIQIIDAKKAQNLSILLKALNVTSDEVHDALVEGNELPAELVETLIKMAPSEEEELKLRLFDGEMSKLGPAERFLKVIVDIPFAFKRFDILLFMSTMDEDLTTLKDAYATLEAASKELKNSRVFFKLLEAVLKTGNRMNDGTYRGGAQAFKLNTLLKLADVKGLDGKTTLLHFVVQEIIRSEGIKAVRASRQSMSLSSVKSEDLQMDEAPEDYEERIRDLGLQVVSGLSGQFENVKKAASIDSDILTGSIGKIGTSLVKSRNFLNKEMKGIEEENGFHLSLKSFVADSEVELKWLLEEEKRIMGQVKGTVDYFHGNTGKDDGLQLFVVVRDFLLILERVCKEIRDKPRKPPPKKEAPSRQTSNETPRTPATPDIRQKLFNARQNQPDSSSDDSSDSDSSDSDSDSD